MVGNFVEEQKTINVQLTQKINTVEITLNSIMDGFQNEMALKFDTLQCLISRLTNQLQVQEKGKFPSQTQPNPRGIHEIASASEPAPRMDIVNAIITLRSGKKVEQPVLKPVEETKEEKEVEP